MNTLVVNILGRRVNFCAIATKIHKTWTKNGKIQVIDMMMDFIKWFLVAKEDYNFSLHEDPWRVTDHYLIVQQ